MKIVETGQPFDQSRFHYTRFRGLADTLPAINELRDRKGRIRLGLIKGNVLDCIQKTVFERLRPKVPRSNLGRPKLLLVKQSPKAQLQDAANAALEAKSRIEYSRRSAPTNFQQVLDAI
ncbi:hypothetical protein C1J05_17270 [Sulfitobacter sp. JL08]|nr:hypothetical protein C1J05_17270 [Sulfitobacter sp. JL08]